MNDVIVGVDIGTSNVRVVIAEYTEDGELQITGTGVSPSKGLKKGIVLNIEETVQAIRRAVEDAEMQAGQEVTFCVVSIGGSQIEGLNSKGSVAVSEKGNEKEKDAREIDNSDIERVIEAASAIPLTIDREIMHVIPQMYIVDGLRDIKNPLAMIGCRLEVEIYIVTAAKTSKASIERCVHRADYELAGIMLKTIAASRATMNREERELGSILIDLGAGTTEAIVVCDDAPLCTCSVPLGGQTITNDIAVVKGISFNTAEQIKLQAGCCFEDLLDSYEEIIIPGVGGRPPEQISRKELCQIIQPRVEEILCLVRDKIALQTKKTRLAGNVVLCGGGAKLPGIADLAQQVFDTSSVRIGYSAKIAGPIDDYLSPEFATATGLVLCNADVRRKIQENNANANVTSRRTTQNQGKMVQRLKDFLREFF